MRPQTQYKLEYKLLYSLVVAGKSAKFAENALAKFFGGFGHPKEPFHFVRTLIVHNCLGSALRTSKTGNYTKLERAFKAIVEADLDLRLCSPQDLEKIPGIGPKTSRFFILWTRPGAKYAALDTHILKWMRYRGFKAPLSTPVGPRYYELEATFLAMADIMKMTPGELDEKIWTWCRDNNNKGLDYSKAESWPEELR